MKPRPRRLRRNPSAAGSLRTISAATRPPCLVPSLLATGQAHAQTPRARSYEGGVTEEAGAGAPGRRSYPKGVRRRQQILQSAIALFARQGVDRASLRSVGEAIGVSHAALRHYFSSRDELLVEVYRTHEALTVGDASAADESAVGVIIEAAERNRSIPGLVELYATLSTDALQEGQPGRRGVVGERVRALLG